MQVAGVYLSRRCSKGRTSSVPHGDRRNALCDRNRLVEVLALDQMVATELLLGFAKGLSVMASLPFFPLTMVAVEVDCSFAPAR